MTETRRGNDRLSAVIAHGVLTHAQVARAVVRIAEETDVKEFLTVGRSHVSHWAAGTKPSGQGALLLCEALSRLLRRAVTLDEIGLAGTPAPHDPPSWGIDTLTTLADIGRVALDADRRRLLGAGAYSLVALALPDARWWEAMARTGRNRATTSRLIGRGDVDAVRDMVAMFSTVDQRRGGGHARTAVVQYLTSDVAECLRGRFATDTTRKDMFSAASELSYLAGWMAFDNAEHNVAQHFFTVGVKLAAEADDPPMAAHVLRAMAHQAVDLGHLHQAVDLAEASVDGDRYGLAAPRERALLGVVHARALAAAGDRQAAAVALVRAEDDLRSAELDDDEPSRVFFFGEASLAHETACTLRDTGDLPGAANAFRHSVRTRKAAVFTRTHAVTLGYLGAVQAQQGSVEEACATWSIALNAMDGVRSGRTRQVARDIRSVLSPFRQRGMRAVIDTDRQAAAYLASTG